MQIEFDVDDIDQMQLCLSKSIKFQVIPITRNFLIPKCVKNESKMIYDSKYRLYCINKCFPFIEYFLFFLSTQTNL